MQKKRIQGDEVTIKISDSEFSRGFKVADVRLEEKSVGDSRRTYQLKMPNGNLYNGGEWIAQQNLLDP